MEVEAHTASGVRLDDVASAPAGLQGIAEPTDRYKSAPRWPRSRRCPEACESAMATASGAACRAIRSSRSRRSVGPDRIRHLRRVEARFCRRAQHEQDVRARLRLTGPARHLGSVLRKCFSPSILAGASKLQPDTSTPSRSCSTCQRTQQAAEPACTGGHLIVPYEQYTQQAPAFGRSTMPQPSHS